MDKNALKEHLKELVQLHAPSGFEQTVQDYLRETWASLVDEFETDGLGSLFGIKHGTGEAPRKRVMLSAHMDEIGLLVVEIKDGYLRLESIRGVDERIMLAKPVLVHTRTGPLPGVVAAVPPHISQYTGGQGKYVPFKSQWVDLGLPADEVAELVEVGDFVTMDAPPLELMGDKLAAKALDDRAAVAAVTACLHHLQTRRHSWDVYAVASAQEEVGLKGAATAAYKAQPDIAIALDVTFAQQPGLSNDDFTKLGKGPCIGIGPNFHDGLYDSLQAAAKSLEMELFVEPTPGRSGTDAWAIQVSRVGVPTALLSIPVRNMHTTVETVSLVDIERTGRLLAAFIEGLAPDYLESIQWTPDAEQPAPTGEE